MAGLGKRLLVAGWGIPLILGATWAGGIWLALLMGAISLLALDEYYRLHIKMGRRPMRLVGLTAGVMIIINWSAGGSGLGWILALTMAFYAIIGIIHNRSHTDLMAGITGVCYIPLLAGSFLFIRNYADPTIGESAGRWLAFAVWGAIWVGDTAAYLGGRWTGKRPLATQISPKKTVEGFIWGLGGALVFALVWSASGFIQLEPALVIGLAAGTAGQVGDLVESKIKREAGVKDTSSLLPGHGGILDRFDSLLTTAPVVAAFVGFGL